VEIKKCCGRCTHFYQTSKENIRPIVGQCRYNPPQVMMITEIVDTPMGMQKGKPVIQRQQTLKPRSFFPPMPFEDPGCSQYEYKIGSTRHDFS